MLRPNRMPGVLKDIVVVVVEDDPEALALLRQIMAYRGAVDSLGIIASSSLIEWRAHRRPGGIDR